MITRIKRSFTSLKSRGKVIYKRTVLTINRRPLFSFFTILIVLLLLIILGNFLRRPAVVEKKATPVVKTVEVYHIGAAPRVRLQAQIEKSGVITITSLTAGVVQELHVKQGDYAPKGTTLVSLSTTYQGGNIPTLQKQLAGRQLQNVNDTYNTQKDLIQKQRELAEKQNTNASDLRTIQAKSIDETKSLISLNNDILSTLDKNLATLNSTNVGGTNDSSILAIKELQSSFKSANNSLNAQLRTTEYNTSNSNAPAQIADLQKDITLKQLEIQEKALALNREVARLQFQIAKVTEQTMFPAAPINAMVDRVLVKVGQAVQPGTPLVMLSQGEVEDPIIAIAYAPNEIARNVSFIEPSTLYINRFTYDTYPAYVSQDAVQGKLYGIYFDVPENYYSFLTEKGYIEVDVPVGYYQTGAAIPFIPIDAIYQTKSQAYVYVVSKGKAKSRLVTLGPVFGSFVHVESGLSEGDIVIVNRTVIDGDPVQVR